MKKSDDGYDDYKDRQAEISRERSAKGREIGPLPSLADPARRESCRLNFRLFCETYHAEQFPLAWSDDHFKAIHRIEDCALNGGLYALAMPRASGKTTLAEVGTEWVILYGHRSFVVVVAASEPKATDILESIKNEIETNEILLEDFPEACYPIVRLEGINNRANGQTLDGDRTCIEWTANEVVFPKVVGSKSSESCIKVAGITGAIRGMKRKIGKRTHRPDWVILDDPSTEESAYSVVQNNFREKVIKNAVLGLAGPGKKISCIMPCTVIAPGDLADRMLDRERNPAWRGERTKLIYSLPTNVKLWDEYAEIRHKSQREGGRGEAATEFYKNNQSAMDSGAQPAWPARFEPGQISATQYAMDLRIDNPRGFSAEYQNDPEKDRVSGTGEDLTPELLLTKLTGLPRLVVPRECTRITAFIDVQSRVLFYGVIAWNEKFGGSIIDYGCWPEQNRSYFSAEDARPTLQDVANAKTDNSSPGLPPSSALMPIEATWHMGLVALTTHILGRAYPRDETQEPLQVEKCLIDANWGPSTDTVYTFIRRSAYSNILLPWHGRGITASNLPMGQWAKKPGERHGSNWIVTSSNSQRGKHVVADVNSWKTFVAERLRTLVGSAGCLEIFGNKKTDHQLLFDHLTAEYRVLTSGRGRQVEEWKIRPDRTENHWWDTVVGAAVAASIQGLQWSSAAAAGDGTNANNDGPKKMKLSEIQRQRKGG